MNIAARGARCLAALVGVLALAGWPLEAWAIPAPEARGALSLAWDEFDSGRCDTALKYLDGLKGIDGEGGDRLNEESVWLRIECLRATGDFETAATLLEAPASAGYEWREEAWDYLMEEWSASATAGGDYAGAQKILARGLLLSPENLLFQALAASTAYRSELSDAIATDKEGRLTGGGEVGFFDKGVEPTEVGWVPCCPAKTEEWWVDLDTCSGWMRKAEKKLAESSRVVWIRLAAEDFRKALEFEAGKAKLKLETVKGEAIFSRDGFRWLTGLEEYRRRSVAEGLGIRGGALLMVSEATHSINLQKELVSWIRAHTDDASIQVSEDDLILKRSRTGRLARFRLADWVELFSEDRRSWETLWGEVLEELGHPKRPWRCFCGREMVLREVLAGRWEGLPTMWKGDGVASVLLASCPQHWMIVSGETLKEWGVTVEEAVVTAARQATESTWELSFEREMKDGKEYFVFAGTGASALARKPALLLGLLHAMEGRDMGGQTVKVWVPLSDALVLGPSTMPDEMGIEAASHAAEMVGEVNSWSGPLRYRATVELPKRAEGNFRLLSRE